MIYELSFLNHPKRKTPVCYTITSNQCWEIISHKGKTYNGYSRIRYKSKYEAAHRIMWMYFKGNIPNNLCVLHKCDNRACINLEHLFLGTVNDNNQDKMRKGRHVSLKGEMHPRSVFTDEQVREIKLLKNQFTSKQLALKYGVSRHTIKTVWRPENWKHITNQLEKE